MAEHESPAFATTAGVREKEWYVIDSDDPDQPTTMTPDSATANIGEVRSNPGVYQVLIDEPDFFMWRWRAAFKGVFIIYIKRRIEQARAKGEPIWLKKSS